jgi:ribosomal protein L11 methyltransferase
LEFVEEAVASLDGKEISALDVGTGSGILAIALAKVGVSNVLAIDSDPIALKVAQVNVRRNRVGRIVTLSNFGMGRVKRPFTIVAATLTAETIIGLADALTKRVSPHGYLILSGILKPNAAEVLRHFCPSPFTLARQTNQREWATLLLRKTG